MLAFWRCSQAPSLVVPSWVPLSLCPPSPLCPASPLCSPASTPFLPFRSNFFLSSESQAAAYEFTTLTCIPGNIIYNDTKIQLLALPGRALVRSGRIQGGHFISLRVFSPTSSRHGGGVLTRCRLCQRHTDEDGPCRQDTESPIVIPPSPLPPPLPCYLFPLQESSKAQRTGKGVGRK